ncbi:MAG: haloacid dehalogenase-like hydrolase [Spirochaetota bacterium]
MDRYSWEENIWEHLQEVGTSTRGLAAFDFDNTMIQNDLGEAIMKELLDNKLLYYKGDFAKHFRDEAAAIQIRSEGGQEDFTQFVWQEYDYIMEKQGAEEAYRWTSFIFSGMSVAELKEISRNTWKKNLSCKNIFPFREIVSLVQFLQDLDWDVRIVTASPQVCIEEVSWEFGIKPEKVIGMQLEEVEGVIAPKILEPFTYGKGKVEALKKNTEQRLDLAFGDSWNDYPLLTSSQLGVLIDKGDDLLREECLGNGILVQPVFDSKD